MRILLIPDSFKGTFEATEMIQKFAEVLSDLAPSSSLIGIPMADGGEGSLEALKMAISGIDIYETTVNGPMVGASPIQVTYGLNGTTAYIEMAKVAGLNLLPKTMQNPRLTTTYGVGELMKHVVDRGAKQIYMAIGGSGSNDGGLGMLLALGAEVITTTDEVDPRSIGTGEGLMCLKQINLEPVKRWCATHDLKVTVMCDVNNPLTGLNGATHVYARQKGASEADILFLEKAMCHYEKLLNQPKMTQMAGAGAAGGIGAALAIGLNATLVSGADLIIALSDFNSVLSDVDLVVTGEGSVDAQTLNGKVAIKVLSAVKKVRPDIPVVLLAGRKSEGWREVMEKGFYALYTTLGDGECLSQDRNEQILRLTDAIHNLILEQVLRHS